MHYPEKIFLYYLRNLCNFSLTFKHLVYYNHDDDNDFDYLDSITISVLNVIY